jgi:hypothetical protein
VDIGVYRAITGLFGTKQCNLSVNSYEINIVRIKHTWFFGIIIAIMLINGGVEMNPGPKNVRRAE